MAMLARVSRRNRAIDAPTRFRIGGMAMGCDNPFQVFGHSGRNIAGNLCSFYLKLFILSISA